MESFILVLQETLEDTPSLIYVQASTVDLALDHVPNMARDFFGEVPKRMRTWRIARSLGQWCIFVRHYGPDASSETRIAPRAVPVSVLKLLMRIAGGEDGWGACEHGLVIKPENALAQYGREFAPFADDERERVAREFYAKGWMEGTDEAVTAQLVDVITARGGVA